MMTYNEMLEILRGKVLHESAEATQQRLNEIADALERAIRERDAAVADLEKFAGCRVCSREDIEYCIGCTHCFSDGKYGLWKKWEWRGVQEVQDE